MKYQVGEQVYVKSNGELEIIEGCETICETSIYYTLTGKSFAEFQLSRYHKVKEDVKELIDDVVNFLSSKVVFKFKNPEKFTAVSLYKDLEKIKKERLNK